MIITDDHLDRVLATEFAAATGWDPKPEGLCRGEVCVPAPGAFRDDGTVDVVAAGGRMGMPVLHDERYGLTAIGPGSTTGHTLSTAAAPDPELIDRHGEPFHLSSLRGRKVLLVAWASYSGCRLSLPGWQALHAELEPAGLTVVTVALDIEPAHAHPWIDAAAPTHPSLIDTEHVTGELFGFINIPMAVWIDESGTIVRNAETASIERSSFRDMDIPDGLPDRMTQMFTEVKAIPDDSAAYRDAIVDWARRGQESAYVLPPDEVVARSRPRGAAEAEAAACFELGRHLRATHRRGGGRAVVAPRPRARPRELDLQAAGLDLGHDAGGRH